MLQPLSFGELESLDKKVVMPINYKSLKETHDETEKD